MQPFDPYHIWLGIPANLHPLNLYQLLGLQTFETDINVIVNAADQRMAHVKSFANGPYGPQSQQLLNELSQAKVHLIDPQLRANYDAQLHAAIAQVQTVVTQSPAAVNPAPVATPIAASITAPIQHPAPIQHAAPETSHVQPTAAPQIQPAPAAEAAPVAAIPTAEPTTQDSVQEVLDLAAHPLAHLERDPSLATPAAATDSKFEFNPTSGGTPKKKSTFPIAVAIFTALGIAAGLLWIFIVGDSKVNPVPNEVATTPAPDITLKFPPVVPSPTAEKTDPPKSPTLIDPPINQAPIEVASQPSAAPRDAVGDAIGKIADDTMTTVAAAPPAEPIDPVAAAIGGISPPRDNGETDEPTGEFGSDDPVEEEVTPAPPVATEVMPKAVKPLPREFFGMIGEAFFDLQADNFKTYGPQRDKVRNMAQETNNAASLAAIARLEQMEFSRAKVWELVNITVGSLSATQEITAQNGTIASVIEASPDKLILRVSGESRRYFAERGGPFKIFRGMSPELVDLLAGLVDERSAQAERALSFHRALISAKIPDDPAQAWEAVNKVWSDGGETPPEFFGIPAAEANNGNNVGNANGANTNMGGAAVVAKPNEGPGYHVARFQFNGRTAAPETIKVPANITGEPKLEITRIYLGPTLGLRKPSATNRYLTTGGTWNADGDFTKLQLLLKPSRDGLQLRTSGSYRRDRASSFRFEPLSLTKIAVQGKAAVSGLEKKRFDVPTAVATALSGRPPLGLLSLPPDANIDKVINEIGNLSADVNKQLIFVLRLQQIRDFAKELQEEGWVELKFVAE